MIEWPIVSMTIFLPLIGALNDRKMLVRSSAIMALGEIGDERAIDPLNGLLKNATNGQKSTIKNSLFLIINKEKCSKCGEQFRRSQQKRTCKGCNMTFHNNDKCVKTLNIFNSTIFCFHCNSEQKSEFGSKNEFE